MVWRYRRRDSALGKTGPRCLRCGFSSYRSGASAICAQRGSLGQRRFDETRVEDDEHPIAARPASMREALEQRSKIGSTRTGTVAFGWSRPRSFQTARASLLRGTRGAIPPEDVDRFVAEVLAWPRRCRECHSLRDDKARARIDDRCKDWRSVCRGRRLGKAKPQGDRGGGTARRCERRTPAGWTRRRLWTGRRGQPLHERDADRSLRVCGH